MNDFESLFESLKNTITKTQLNIKKFTYENFIFNLTIDQEDYKKINHGDIIIFNHKTKQYRIFKFFEETNNYIKFKCDKLFLIMFHDV